MAKRSKSKDAVPRTETAPAEENPAPPESENTKIEWEKQPGSLPAAEEAVSRSEYLEAGSQESIIEAVSIEAAVTPEFEILEEIGKESLDALDELGREGLEATESAASSFAKTLWAFVADTASYSKESFESGSELLGRLARAKNPAAAIQIQADYASSAYTRFLEHLLKMNELYWDVVEELSKRVSGKFAKAEA